MRKIIYTLVIGAVMIGSLVACGKKETADDGTKNTTETTSENTTEAENKNDVDVQEVADKLLGEGEFKDTLAEVDQNIALGRLYTMDASIVEEAVFYTNSNATAEEIAVIKVVDAKDVETVKVAFEARIEDQKEACKDYLPDEMSKLEDALIYSKGNYIILCISVDSDKAEDLVEGFFQ